MLIYTYIGIYVIYSILIGCCFLALEEKVGRLSILALCAIAAADVMPLVDIHDTMQIIPTLLFSFSVLVIVGIILSFFRDKDAKLKNIKIIKVVQEFYRAKEYLYLDTLLFVVMFWAAFLFVSCLIAPIFQSMNYVLGTLNDHMVEILNKPNNEVIVNTFSYTHFYIIHLSILSVNVFFGAIFYYIKQKLSPSVGGAQLAPFLDMDKEKMRKSEIKEIPQNQMKKIILANKFVLIRDSKQPISKEEEVIAKINELQAVVFTAVLVDTYYMNRKLFGVIHENNTLKFYKVNRPSEQPPTNPNVTDVKEDKKIQGALPNA